jgi:uncharacterized protein YndB with AHSA1/START domain
MSLTFGNIVAILGGALLIAIGAVLIRAATLSDQMRIVRSVAIAAPPAAIYPMIADMKRFNEWNPFARGDLAAEITYTNATEGVGAGYTWTTPGKPSAGKLRVTDAKPTTSVSMQLNFEKPFVAENYTVFTLTPRGDDTEVTWAMTGANPFMARIFNVIFRLDKVLGRQFEQGLGALKEQAAK